MSFISGSGIIVGSIATFPLTGWLCKCGFAGGWPSVFYISGKSCIVCTVVKFDAGCTCECKKFPLLTVNLQDV